MLILTRSINQLIRIGDDIAVTVLITQDNRGVRLGISAPKETPVHRSEVYARIQKQEGVKDV